MSTTAHLVNSGAGWSLLDESGSAWFTGESRAACLREAHRTGALRIVFEASVPESAPRGRGQLPPEPRSTSRMRVQQAA